MNFKTYRFSLLLLAFLSFVQLQAQVKNCKISYDIDITSDEMDEMTKSMMEGATMVMSFMEQKSKVEMKMSMMTSTAIMDQEAKKGVILMDMMGMKIASPMEDADFDDNSDQFENYDVKATGEMKKIAGYKCEKMIVTAEDGTTVAGWYCKELTPDVSTKYNFSKVPGFPLEMQVNSDGVAMHLVATKVETKKLDSESFSTETPAGYTTMTQQQLQQMGGGR